jgi:flavin-dependent dehydrogenase
VLIVGSGPAGADLAWRLACGGADVVLVDRLADLTRAAFSSAALPMAAVREHHLPEAVIAARWRGWQLLGPGSQRRLWMADEPLGAVLDFGALRQWLAQRAAAAGARLQLGVHCEGWQATAAGARVQLRHPDGQRRTLHPRWLVDATGQQRALLGEPPPSADPLVAGVGVEWLLQVDPLCWRRWAEQLSFMLGSDWVPQGYGWVFPMQPGVLKLGICRLQDPGTAQPPLQGLLRQLLVRLGLADATVLDRHGGLVRSSIRRREPHRRGPLLGLGDAISTANLLGGEGIRHALSSSTTLAPLLLAALAGNPQALSPYHRRLRRRLGWRWSLSGRLAQRTWLGLKTPAADRRLERLLTGMEACNAEDLSALLFDYRFERYGLRALPYALGWR